MLPRIYAMFVLLRFLAVSSQAADATAADLERAFTSSVHPFLESFCIDCHSGEKPKAQLDLSAYPTMAKVAADYRPWELVLEKLQASEMPPKKAKQHPTPEAREAVITWIKGMLQYEANKNAGDPGPVLARRLSNAEYDYTIRDLT